MATQTSSIAVVAVAVPIADRKDLIRRESVRDFAGVAVGVAIGALVWIALLSAIRLPV